ncbi:MAG: DUF3198 domain-containing protein [Thermoplasmata archaeon]
MTLKKTIRKHQGILGVIGLILGIFLLVLGIFGVFLNDYSPKPISDLNAIVGNWTYWFLVLGALLILFLGIYVYDRYSKIKEFKELINTQSKSKFRKNIARLETLALTLGPEYEEEFLEKEEEFGIRR